MQSRSRTKLLVGLSSGDARFTADSYDAWSEEHPNANESDVHGWCSATEALVRPHKVDTLHQAWAFWPLPDGTRLCSPLSLLDDTWAHILNAHCLCCGHLLARTALDRRDQQATESAASLLSTAPQPESHDAKVPPSRASLPSSGHRLTSETQGVSRVFDDTFYDTIHDTIHETPDDDAKGVTDAKEADDDTQLVSSGPRARTLRLRALYWSQQASAPHTRRQCSTEDCAWAGLYQPRWQCTTVDFYCAVRRLRLCRPALSLQDAVSEYTQPDIYSFLLMLRQPFLPTQSWTVPWEFSALPWQLQQNPDPDFWQDVQPVRAWGWAGFRVPPLPRWPVESPAADPTAAQGDVSTAADDHSTPDATIATSDDDVQVELWHHLHRLLFVCTRQLQHVYESESDTLRKLGSHPKPVVVKTVVDKLNLEVLDPTGTSNARHTSVVWKVSRGWTQLLELVWSLVLPQPARQSSVSGGPSRVPALDVTAQAWLERLCGKDGLVRKGLLGFRVDTSGAFTATLDNSDSLDVDPHTGAIELGLPRSVQRRWLWSQQLELPLTPAAWSQWRVQAVWRPPTPEHRLPALNLHEWVTGAGLGLDLRSQGWRTVPTDRPDLWEVGDWVYRHPAVGDLVLLVRPPVLGTDSLLSACIAYWHDEQVLRVPLCATEPLNGDFDGDVLLVLGTDPSTAWRSSLSGWCHTQRNRVSHTFRYALRLDDLPTLHCLLRGALSSYDQRPHQLMAEWQRAWPESFSYVLTLDPSDPDWEQYHAQALRVDGYHVVVWIDRGRWRFLAAARKSWIQRVCEQLCQCHRPSEARAALREARKVLRSVRQLWQPVGMADTDEVRRWIEDTAAKGKPEHLEAWQRRHPPHVASTTMITPLTPTEHWRDHSDARGVMSRVKKEVATVSAYRDMYCAAVQRVYAEPVVDDQSSNSLDSHSHSQYGAAWRLVWSGSATDSDPPAVVALSGLGLSAPPLSLWDQEQSCVLSVNHVLALWHPERVHAQQAELVLRLWRTLSADCRRACWLPLHPWRECWLAASLGRSPMADNDGTHTATIDADAQEALDTVRREIHQWWRPMLASTRCEGEAHPEVRLGCALALLCLHPVLVRAQWGWDLPSQARLRARFWSVVFVSRRPERCEIPRTPDFSVLSAALRAVLRQWVQTPLNAKHWEGRPVHQRLHRLLTWGEHSCLPAEGTLPPARWPGPGCGEPVLLDVDPASGFPRAQVALQPWAASEFEPFLHAWLDRLTGLRSVTFDAHTCLVTLIGPSAHAAHGALCVLRHGWPVDQVWLLNSRFLGAQEVWFDADPDVLSWRWHRVGLGDLWRGLRELSWPHAAMATVWLHWQGDSVRSVQTWLGIEAAHRWLVLRLRELFVEQWPEVWWHWLADVQTWHGRFQSIQHLRLSETGWVDQTLQHALQPRQLGTVLQHAAWHGQVDALDTPLARYAFSP